MNFAQEQKSDQAQNFFKVRSELELVKQSSTYPGLGLVKLPQSNLRSYGKSELCTGTTERSSSNFFKVMFRVSKAERRLYRVRVRQVTEVLFSLV